MIRLEILIKSLLCIILVFMTVSCVSIQKSLDTYSLNRNKKGILKNFTPGDVVTLENYIDSFDLERLTKVAPDSTPIKTEPLLNWHIKSKVPLNYEKWLFKSDFFKNKTPGDAVFYVFKQQPFVGSNVVLFVPGFGVSDFAFGFIKKFFTAEIEAGYNIVMYIPPYHMDRQKKGESPGNGLVTASPLNTVQIMINSVKELRMVYSYLIAEGADSIGGWGGSMGGALTLMLQSLEELDHLALMIPVLDWNTFITPEEIFPRYEKEGFSRETIHKAYLLISPVSYPLTIQPERVQIEAALYDQLNPVDIIRLYAENNGIKNFHTYKTGHAAILLDKKIYRDYSLFLKGL